ncbi:MAG: hypothetical protein HOQ11_13710 [Gemmatimonadaceae bacterium]|nr:hypothetical protein [Gemmatimonadaceae bacterium]NUQ91991.1 hypothetical protein [Gemmatimonadaceae bacterium]NUR20696.1 hypothetical protein [Gemmatimonadaceae bacterium]NUS98457.1 hypothetical protein [Gemmatimonadaceae bacterium]
MKQFRLIVAGLAGIAIAACGRSSKATDLGSELEAASGDTSGLLVARGGTQVVSAIERTSGGVPAANGTSKMKTPAATAKKPTTHVATPEKADPVPAPLPSENGTVAAVDPAPSDAPVTVVPAPSTKPASQGAGASKEKMPFPTGDQRHGRRGGWSSTSDVIRNAPFPINP